MEYLFILGRSSQLCQAELETVLESLKINYQIIFSSSEVFHFKTPKLLEINNLIKVLGGTVKIGEVLGEIKDLEDLGWLGSLGQGKLEFGLSGFGGINSFQINKLSREIKEELGKEGRKSRFVLPKEGNTIASVVVEKQHLTEIILLKESLEGDQKIIIGKTLAVQDWRGWGKRDFGRPEADPHSGMLPPKVARMMVNLASQGLTLQNMQGKILLDPFCGMGTILMEGMMRDCQVIGSDISMEAVKKTQRNLDWLVLESKSLKLLKFKVFQHDATHISEKLPANSVDAIVTEPYLGPNEFPISNFQFPKLQNIITGLEKLYLGCLKEWKKILRPGGAVVMIFPSFQIGKREFFVKKPLDDCENLGYTLEAGPYQYYRPQAVVRRNIYVFKIN